MDNYLGVCLVKAKRVSLKYLDYEMYEVVFPGGQTILMDKDTFNSRFFRITCDDKLTPEDIQKWLEYGHVDTQTVGEKTTVVRFTAPTEFVDVSSSSCVDKNNYSVKLGRKYALEDIKNRVWNHLGFVLQWAKSGLKRNA